MFNPSECEWERLKALKPKCVGVWSLRAKCFLKTNVRLYALHNGITFVHLYVARVVQLNACHPILRIEPANSRIIRVNLTASFISRESKYGLDS